MTRNITFCSMSNDLWTDFADDRKRACNGSFKNVHISFSEVCRHHNRFDINGTLIPDHSLHTSLQTRLEKGTKGNLKWTIFLLLYNRYYTVSFYLHFHGFMLARRVEEGSRRKVVKWERRYLVINKYVFTPKTETSSRSCFVDVAVQCSFSSSLMHPSDDDKKVLAASLFLNCIIFNLR